MTGRTLGGVARAAIVDRVWRREGMWTPGAAPDTTTDVRWLQLSSWFCDLRQPAGLRATWTNGAFVATTHRVREVSEERWSFPLFFTVDYDTPVTPLEGFVREGQPPMETLIAGEHLFAQTAQSFGYLRERLAAGVIALPDGARPLSSFGQEARRPG